MTGCTLSIIWVSESVISSQIGSISVVARLFHNSHADEARVAPVGDACVSSFVVLLQTTSEGSPADNYRSYTREWACFWLVR